MNHTLAQGIKCAEKILREWLAVKKGQRLLFMANPDTDRDFVEAFLAAARELEAEAYVFIKKPHADNLEEYPKPLAEAIKHVDIYFNMCLRSHCNHTLTHLTAVTEYGTRYCMASNLTIDSLFLPENQVSPDELKKRGDYLARKLLGQWVKITTESGTDLSLEFDKDVTGAVYNFTFERGGLASLPGGAQHFHAMDGSANGIIVFDKMHQDRLRHRKLDWSGEKDPQKVRFTIKNHRVTEVSGGSGNRAKEIWDEMKSIKNADYMGEVGFGLNPGIKAGDDINDSSRAEGSMHFGFGDSLWYGGRVTCPILRIHMLYHPRIEVNGKVVVENNRFPLLERSENHG